jgi:hypothetical protein
MCSEDLVTGGPITGAELPTGRIDDAELPVAIAAAATALLVHGAATGPFQESCTCTLLCTAASGWQRALVIAWSGSGWLRILATAGVLLRAKPAEVSAWP